MSRAPTIKRRLSATTSAGRVVHVVELQKWIPASTKDMGVEHLPGSTEFRMADGTDIWFDGSKFETMDSGETFLLSDLK